MKYRNDYGTLILTKSKQKQAKAQPITKYDLSSDQRAVFTSIQNWVYDNQGKTVLSLGGYAGTGKSTLLAILAHGLQKANKIAFCSYTGKAANVLRQKLTAAFVDLTENYCGTIHKLIYEPHSDNKGNIIDWFLMAELPFDLIIIDEASMVDEKLFADLKSFGIPILAVGDHGQLPPIGQGVNLMDKPDLRLEVIHRQAEDNPIIALSKQIRETGNYTNFANSDQVKRVPNRLALEMLEAKVRNKNTDLMDLGVLCYTNKLRTQLNQQIRSFLKREGDPTEKDIVICLRNTRFQAMSVYNGMRGVLKRAFHCYPHKFEADVVFEDDDLILTAYLSKYQFLREKTFAELGEFESFKYKPFNWKEPGMLFDYGYCLTVHKAQGSQFQDVFVDTYKPGMTTSEDWRRWLYTAVTRAVETVVLM